MAPLAARRPQRPDRLDDAVASLGRGGRGPGQHRAGGGLGVDRIRLATLPAGAPVRPVDLHDRNPTVQQQPGQAGAIAAGAFDPDRLQVPVATQPAKQLPVATTVRGELPVAQQPSLLVDDGGVVVRPWVSTPPMTTLVRLLVRLGMLVSPFRSRHEPGQARTGRAGGHTSDRA
jgi:hypothetical protein